MTTAASHPLARAAALLLFLLLSPLLPPAVQAQEDTNKQITLSFGVVPQQSSTKMASRWVPFLRYLSLKSGYRIVFNTAKDIPTFEKRCTAGAYDLAYMNPLHYVIYNISPGYRVFAKEKLKALSGIIVVGKDSSYRELAELHGAELAFPSPGAFAASIVTRGHLKKIGVEFSPHYLTSHDSVYRAVSQGLFAAGGGVPRTLRAVAPEIRDQLRVLWTSEGYPPHAIAAHPRTPEAMVGKIGEIMVGMDRDPQGRLFLDNLFFQAIVPAQDSDWNAVRDLGIDLTNNPANN